MWATADMHRHRPEDLEQGVLALKELAFPHSGNTISNVVLGVARHLVQFFARVLGSLVTFGSSFLSLTDCQLLSHVKRELSTPASRSAF